MKGGVLLDLFYRIKIIRSIVIPIFTMCFLFSCGVSGCYGNSYENLGLINSLLKPCPKSPNCVSSQSSVQENQIDPISFSDSLKEVKVRLKKAIELTGKTNFVTQKHLYWHIEFTTRFLGFVDDVEFFFDKSQSIIHVRSASRLGYWDFGVNRNRVEKIRSHLEKSVNGN